MTRNIAAPRVVTIADLRRLASDYDRRYREGKGVYASYEVAYFRARKG